MWFLLCMETGIIAGCTVSPLTFTVGMKPVIRASGWITGGEKLWSEAWLQPTRVYDTTTNTTGFKITFTMSEPWKSRVWPRETQITEGVSTWRPQRPVWTLTNTHNLCVLFHYKYCCLLLSHPLSKSAFTHLHIQMV